MMCTKCDIDKPLDHFRKGSQCRVCERKQIREHSSKKTALIRRYKMMKGCELCGYRKHPSSLHLDHIDPSEKDLGAGRQTFSNLGWDRMRAEIKKCRVLCANCHGAHTADQMKMGLINKRKPTFK